ncbi:efflux RND transporter permease subunit [Halosquirtibacter xylanolyticus]|uniref:efflux RND transporter permease subunit n=1 Tax=Halosquirtibacter xylanolyticus TaxID=3374599 RepID=UPI0037499F3B|nr:efflux RND transporter permease subunit [Prolixibacteraceae bacterium]
MNITEFSIKKSRIVMSILMMVLITGAISYSSLSRDSMPPYTVRVASIVSSFPGASPQRVENLVTDKIEEVALELPELKKVTSTSRMGLSVVNVELKMDVSPNKLQDVWDRLRLKLEALNSLPSGVKPNLQDEGIGEVFGIVMGLTSDGFEYDQMKEVAEEIKNELIMLDGAAKVEINGIQKQQILIEYDNAKLQRLGISQETLKQQIASTNILASGGMIHVDKHRVVLEPSGNFDDLEGLRSLLIPVGKEGGMLYLRDIAKIKKSYVDPSRQMVFVNGDKALTLHVSLKDGANIIALGQSVDQFVNDYIDGLPIGYNLERVSSLDQYIDLKIDNFVSNLVQSILIVFAVMLIFLGLRMGLIIASLIPIVTIATIFIMGMLDIGINQISLAALIMALGMMVDNGIVVAESIMVKVDQGEKIARAAILSCSELVIPLLISTLTTSVAFSSFYLAKSVMGDIMGPLFVVISISLIASWFVSLSVITFFCVVFHREAKATRWSKTLDRMFDQMKQKYYGIIGAALRHKKSVLLATVVTFMMALILFSKLSFVFFPDSDRNMITLDLQLPEGMRVGETEKVIHQIEDYIDSTLLTKEVEQRGVTAYSSYIGEGPSSYDLGYTADEPNSNYAHMLINTTSFLANRHVIEMLDKYCIRAFPDAQIKVRMLGGGGGGTPIEIKVKGKDPEQLSRISSAIKTKLNNINGTKTIKDDWGRKSLKYVVHVRSDKALEAKISNENIANALNSTLVGYNVGEFREQSNSYPIDLREEDGNHKLVDELKTILVFSSQTGKPVPLEQVAEMVPVWEYPKITRENTKRTITISSELTFDGNAAQIMAQMKPWIQQQSKTWPRGYSYSVGGEEENSAENMMAVAKYIPFSFFCILLLLMLQFNSIRKMTMVVATIPLGVIGMVAGLFVFNNPFGFMAFLGMISLAGIVINNAIVLVDRIDFELDADPKSRVEAVIEACVQRFRPIILSTLTTVMGLIPLYLNGGEIWQPMAITIMVGLLFGTVITLVFIPVVYCSLYKIN